ncbi:MAG TPA: DUF1175 domain-containing protein [Pseudothermotoga sp.]|nr:DUF1175 domain-containing protein [Pseudothermotoga sp.]HOK84325.1 DUF1175 domain-containing protein [Pseudothermotoga sp.]HPP70737.1 DUF1175 domain-containing protein [Pseudothermotoga sp.]
MKIYQIMWLAIATAIALITILDFSFQVKLEVDLRPLKDIQDIFIEAEIVAAKIYSNRTVKVLNNGLYIPRAKPGEKIELYFESVGFLKKTKSIKFRVEPDLEDRNQDGYPDFLVLSEKDAQRFRNWFIWIGISTFKNDSPLWNKDEMDCAGLVRYCAREALRIHDSYWFMKSKYTGPIFEDVEKYNYPNIPVLGRRMFRVRKGSFNDSSEFSTFAVARILYENSMRFVTKNIGSAKSGDIMVFFHPEDFEFPYHLMIYVGDLGISEDEGWVLYHTGPIGEGSGELRFVRYSELEKLDPSWMPDSKNKYFLGFYRFKFLP